MTKLAAKSIVDTSIAFSKLKPAYGEMYAYNKAIAFNIVTAGVYHAFGLRTASDIVAGLLLDWTFNAGRIVDADITNEANVGGLLEVECSAVHGLVTGDIVTLANMNNAGHNKATRVTYVDTTKFSCDDVTYVAGAGASAGVVYAPAYLQAGSTAAGIYVARFTIDGTAANVNKDWKWELNIGITPTDNIVTERNSTNTLAAMSAGGLITVTVGKRLWISGKNSTDTTDYTVKNFNLNLFKISD